MANWCCVYFITIKKSKKWPRFFRKCKYVLETTYCAVTEEEIITSVSGGDMTREVLQHRDSWGKEAHNTLALEARTHNTLALAQSLPLNIRLTNTPVPSRNILPGIHGYWFLVGVTVLWSAPDFPLSLKTCVLITSDVLIPQNVCQLY